MLIAFSYSKYDYDIPIHIKSNEEYQGVVWAFKRYVYNVLKGLNVHTIQLKCISLRSVIRDLTKQHIIWICTSIRKSKGIDF